MENTKALSSATIQRVSEIDGYKDYKKATWHSMSIYIRKFIPFNEYVDLVHKIIRECTSPDGSVALELLDFALRANIIATYAHVELPEDIGDLYDISYLSGLYEMILSTANKGQIRSIISFVDHTIR